MKKMVFALSILIGLFTVFPIISGWGSPPKPKKKLTPGQYFKKGEEEDKKLLKIAKDAITAKSKYLAKYSGNNSAITNLNSTKIKAIIFKNLDSETPFMNLKDIKDKNNYIGIATLKSEEGKALINKIKEAM